MSKAGVVNEIYKTARVNFPRRHVILKDINDLWQADLVDLQSISSYNCGYKYILVVIDAFSKYVWTIPLKRKTKDEVFAAFKGLFKDKQIPKNLQTDLGTEFYNNRLKKLTQAYNINHYSTFSIKKASIAERFIRTLKTKLYKQFGLNGNYIWINGTLDKVVETYNDTFHRTIGCKPIEVNDETKIGIVERYARLNATSNLVKRKKHIKLNDFVRISKYKGTFEKGYTPNWSTEIFKIIKIQNTNPITYLLEDMKKQSILGAFYAQELQKTKFPDIYLIEKVLKKSKNQVYVKWLGLPTCENSWIRLSNVL